MSHVRQQIREAVAAVLTGLVTTGARVFQSRLRPLRDADLPCLLVNTDDESVEADNAVIGGEMTRRLKLRIRGVAKEQDGLDDLLDSMAEQVETALAGSTLGNRAKLMQLESISVEMDDATEKPVGIITLDYLVMYFTTPCQPGTAL